MVENGGSHLFASRLPLDRIKEARVEANNNGQLFQAWIDVRILNVPATEAILGEEPLELRNMAWPPGQAHSWVAYKLINKFA